MGVESCVIGEIANITPSSVFLLFTSMAEKFGSRLNTQIYELQNLSLVDPNVAIELYMNY